jgi:RuvB-like protein 2
MIIIPTVAYSEKELMQILKIRCEEEDCEMAEDALKVCSKLIYCDWLTLLPQIKS